MTPISPEDVKVLIERLRFCQEHGLFIASAQDMDASYREAADALEAQSRAYVALAERVGVLEEALETVMLNNRTGAVGQIAREGWAKARAALTKDKANG